MSKERMYSVGCSLPGALLLTLVLLVLQYTVAPQLPWWLVFAPIMFWGIGMAVLLTIMLVIFIVAVILSIVYK